MNTSAQKIAVFRQLHAAPGTFAIPNPWDAGSARMLESLGFKALATSSAASAHTLGRKDYGVTRDEALFMAKRIVDAVDIPVSADLEDGFGAKPEDAAETIRQAAELGLSGGSIEDAAGGQPPFDLTLAVERVAAAVEEARKTGFVLTARAENYTRGIANLDDTIARLQAYERAGADVLFAPALPDFAALKAVMAAVKKPVNYMSGTRGRAFPMSELAAIGVKRVSVATALYRAAMTGVFEAARELAERGTSEFVDRALTSPEIGKWMR